MENVKNWKFDDSAIEKIEKIVGENLYLCLSREYNDIWDIIRDKVYKEVIPESASEEERKKAISFAKDDLWIRAGAIYDTMDESQW